MDDDKSEQLDSWLRHPYTARMHKAYKGEQDTAFNALKSYCRQSSDPDVRQAYMAYEKLGVFAKILDGGVE